MSETPERTYCSQRVHEPGAWRDSRCHRVATGDDGLCGPHRAGARKRARGDARYEAQRAQDRYADSWQAAHADKVYMGDWRCPLCRQFVQHTTAGPTLIDAIRLHQEAHGQDWLNYQQAARSAAGEEDPASE